MYLRLSRMTDDRDGQVDQEDQPPAPRGHTHQHAAEDRPERGGDAAESRPRADRRRPVLLAERRLQDRQRPGRQQRGAGPLESTHRDQHFGSGRQRTAHGGGGEPQDADHEDPPPAHPVTERAAEQEQPGQGQRVGVQRPLQAGQPTAEILADARQRDVDDRAVELGQPAAQDRCREHPLAAGGGIAELVVTGTGSLSHRPATRTCHRLTARLSTARHNHRRAVVTPVTAEIVFLIVRRRVTPTPASDDCQVARHLTRSPRSPSAKR